MDMLADIDKDTVDFVPNFDNQGKSRSCCRARLPQLLVNGSSGIAVGMATNIPPHNISEICDAIAQLIDEDDGLSTTNDDCSTSSRVPIFRPAAMLLGREAIRTGVQDRPRFGRDARPRRDHRGKGQVQDRDHRGAVPDHDRARDRRRSTRRTRRSASPASRDLNNVSNRHGMRIVVELQRTADAERRAEPALQADAAADELRLQHAGAGAGARSRRPTARRHRAGAAGALAARHAAALHRAPQGRHPAPHRNTTSTRPKSARTSSKASGSPSTTSTRSSRSIRASDTTEVARERLMTRFSLSLDAGQRDPRHAPAHADRPRASEDRGRIRRVDQTDRRVAKTSSASPRKIAALVKADAARAAQEALRRRAPHGHRGDARRTRRSRTSSPTPRSSSR